MLNQARGFSVVEFVVVTVILAVLSAVAVPKYFALRQEAGAARLQALAGKLSTASLINYTECHVGRETGKVVNSCQALNNQLKIIFGRALPSGVSLSQQSHPVTDGTAFICTLTDSGLTGDNASTTVDLISNQYGQQDCATKFKL
jgi:MSHA pilin protein MshA